MFKERLGPPASRREEKIKSLYWKKKKGKNGPRRLLKEESTRAPELEKGVEASWTGEGDV